MNSNPTPTHTRWPLIIVLWMCGMAASMQFAKVSLAFNAIQAHYSASDSQIGWVLSWVGVFGMVFAAITTGFIERFGYRRLLIGSLLVALVLALYQITLPALPILLFTRMLEGAAHLMIVVTAPTLMAAASSPQQKTMVMGIWGTFFGVTFASVGLLAPELLHMWGDNALFIFHALWLVLVIILLLLSYRHEIIPQPTQRTPITFKNFYQLHLNIYGHLRTALPSLCFINYTALYVALLTFFPKVGEASPIWLVSVLPVTSLASSFLTTFIIQHGQSPIRMTKAAFGSAIIAFILMGIMLWLKQDVSWLKVVVFFTLGLMQGSIYSMIPHLTPESHAQSKSLSGIAQLGNTGSTIGPPLLGAALGTFGSFGMLAVSIILSLIGLILIQTLSKKL